MASTKARNASVAYNMRAVGGLMGAERQLANFKKLRFQNKYKDVPEKQKQALYLEETVNEFALTEAEDTERLHKVRQAAAARQFEALQALPKFGVATYANTKETDPDLAEKAIRAWAHVLEGQNGHGALCEARKELDGLLEGAKCPLPPLTGDRSQPATPPKVSRQLGFKGTPEQPLPPMTRTHAVEQTTWAFQEDDEEPAPEAPAPPPSPAEQTPNAKPAPEAPPEQPRPVLTVDVAAATKPLGAGKNLETALNAAEEKPREWDLSITYIRCPPGHHFIDDEGHIAPNEKKRKRQDSSPVAAA